MEKQGVLNDKKIVGSPMVHMTCLALVLLHSGWFCQAEQKQNLSYTVSSQLW